MQAVAALYEDLGDELTDDARQRMAQWWSDSATSRRQGPRPELAAFGLDARQISEQFDFYHERFGIAPGDDTASKGGRP